MVVWKVGKTFLIHLSNSMLLEMIVSNLTCMTIEYISFKCAKWIVWSFKPNKYYLHTYCIMDNQLSKYKTIYYFSYYFTKSPNLSKLNAQVIHP
ncbi:hypothetical protein LDENG_00261830 [Lucifuga dentata]|nr:hypothetical protein LDENG_00261830 [Lucifuga dentata]